MLKFFGVFVFVGVVIVVVGVVVESGISPGKISVLYFNDDVLFHGFGVVSDDVVFVDFGFFEELFDSG